MLKDDPITIHKNWRIVRKLEPTEEIKIAIEKILARLIISMKYAEANYV